MLTGRGGGFLLGIYLLWAYALLIGISALALVGTVLLLWFLLAWLLFAVRVRLAVPRLRLERRLQDENGRVERLWAGLPYQVVLRITNESRASLSFVVAIDRLPLLADAETVDYHASETLAAGESLTLRYEIRPLAAGRLRFDGVKLLVTDYEGFFATPLFLRDGAVFRCLPPLADARGHIPAVKRVNILPLLGQHPHRRPGSAIELLELRDYLPGDPPKRIAWKISARRDRLMTRAVESEVPIRCTLFVDTSDAVRIGPAGRTALCRLIDIAGAVAQANGAARDLTGLCLFDEERVLSSVRPERGRRHLLDLIQILADHADLFPRVNPLPLDQLVFQAYGLAQDLYPELLDRDINAFPWWLPLWSPRPVYLDPLPRPASPSRLARFSTWIERRLRDTPLGWLWTIPRRFSPGAHRRYRQRKQLAALVAVLQNLGPAAAAGMLEDDALLRAVLARFLADHGQPTPLHLFDDEGNYAFASHAKVGVLAKALLQAVQRGKDDELFVLLVDLLENDDLEPLLGAVRVARARHHQVMLICPWPSGIALPVKTNEEAKAKTLASLLAQDFDQKEIVRLTTEWRLHQAYENLQQRLGRAGVSLLCAQKSDTVPLILARMHRLRVVQRGTR